MTKAIEARLQKLEIVASKVESFHIWKEPGETLSEAVARRFAFGPPSGSAVYLYEWATDTD